MLKNLDLFHIFATQKHNSLDKILFKQMPLHVNYNNLKAFFVHHAKYKLITHYT